MKRTSKKKSSGQGTKTIFKGKDWLFFPSLICLLITLFAFMIYKNIKNTRYQTIIPINPAPSIYPTTNYPSPTPAPEATMKPSSGSGECIIGGCNGEICSDKQMASPCIYKPEFECYKNAICERQEDGSCAWTSTPELISCLGASI